MWLMRSVVTPLLLLLAMGSGCATFNYDIVQPETMRMRVGDDWRRVEAGPVAYRFRSLENHLVVQIFNVTGGALRVVGDRSYIVTPGNQSVPIRSQAIAPGSYMKLVMPPVEQITRPGPSIGFGTGYWGGDVEGAGGAYVETRYLDSSSGYWEWEGETQVTLHLAFEGGAGIVEQTLVIQRVKV